MCSDNLVVIIDYKRLWKFIVHVQSIMCLYTSHIYKTGEGGEKKCCRRQLEYINSYMKG